MVLVQENIPTDVIGSALRRKKNKSEGKDV